MNRETFDLGASRCPDAMIYVRAALERAVSSNFKGSVDIITIEPSMIRDLPYFINNHLGEKLVLSAVSKRPLDCDLKSAWIESGAAIDDDFSNIVDQLTFLISTK